FPDVSATISTSSDQQFSNLSIRDVHVNGGTFTATQSKDDGNTVGWVIDDAVVGRDLYWVGGTGVWEDPAHWSLSSGGPGGECVPNILDNVFFDANSLAPDEYVDTRNYSTAVCHNFTWDGPPASAQFWRWENGGDCCADFHIYGSLDIQTPFILNMSGLEFRGSGDQDYIINTAGVFMNFVQFVNSTQRRLTDDFHGREIRMNAGGLKTSSHSMELQRLEIDSRGAGVQMDLDSSHILLTYPWSRSNYASLHLGSDENLIFDPDHSLIELNNDAVSHIHWHSEYAFHNVLFSSQVGSAELFRGGRDEQLLGTVPMNKLEFRGDGVVYGEHRIDSLLFANGRSYTLESEKIQTVVDHLQIRGNNCIQLGLRSTQAGNPSIIEMAQGEVDGDFIQMQDQIARGGAQFFAGANSADVSNNEGWIFETVQEYVEFGVLGNDRIFCVGQVSLTLNEDDQIGAQGYVWSDGSTGAELDVSSPGKYWVDATYVQGCVLPDTILVLEADDFNVDLGTDQLLCSGVALTLNADLSLVGARYTWGDGISGAERVLDQAGIYDVTVELDGCTDSDTLRLDYVQVPDLALAGSGACLGDTLDLSIDIPNVSVLWSTGATSPGIRVYAPGEYWAQISTNGCSDADTLEIAFEDPIVFDLGPDTLLCEGDELIISGLPDQSNVQYLWEDGVAVADRSISTAGSYRLSAARGLCAFTDSISVTTLDLTLPDLAPTAQYCAGEMANFAVPVDSDQRILWSTGSMIESISLDETGTYWVRVEEAHCAVSDTFDVAFTVPPALSLDEEMAICQGDRVKLGEDIQGATYMWSTGKVTAEVEESPSDNTLYTVEARFGRCASVDSILLIVRPRPMVLIDAPAEVCPSTDYSIAIISDGDALSWMDGDTSAIREFSLPGDFQVTAQLDGCFRDTSFIVEAFPTQFRSLGPDTLICDDTEIQIDLTVPQGISYDWNDGYTESVRTLQMAGSYAVEVDDGNCVFQDTMELTTRSCVYFNAYAPNAFSPNGDGINDEFAIVFDPRIPISNFQLEIFDRWGNQVYAATDPSRWWNGMIKGEVLQGDVYLYHVSFDYIDDNGPGSYEHAADVLLVR
ncbi:MAG: gliding motility-associated C-terminal domain-containing protein, partial [Saprospiraceae bacterium]|nr:gliding motility-associated C-terminal domain-containing protein [Saprospiraceae bacterium]